MTNKADKLKKHAWVNSRLPSSGCNMLKQLHSSQLYCKAHPLYLFRNKEDIKSCDLVVTRETWAVSVRSCFNSSTNVTHFTLLCFMSWMQMSEHSLAEMYI